MTPEQAWQATIGQLQMEMPKATFDTWVRDARFLSFDGGNGSTQLVATGRNTVSPVGSEGTFTIGLENAYARDWVESRLTSTISRILVGILNQQVKIDFVARPHTRGESCPEEAWEAVIEHLRSSASKTNFDRYLRGARFLAYYGNNFIIGLPTNEARGWVEETVNGTASHMLTGLMHQPVNVQFVVAPNQEEETSETQAGSDAGEGEIPASAEPHNGRTLSDETADILIQPVCTSLYETIVRPNKVVVVPAYLLRWLPYLGPDKGWLLIAMRQAFYQVYGKKVCTSNCGQTFTVNRQRIVRWSNLGDKKVWQFLKDLEKKEQAGNFLAWFLQASKNTPGKPKVYTFRADMPLTPGDAEALHAWLLANGIQEQPTETLTKALQQQPRDILPFPPLPPTASQLKMTPNPRTVQDVVLAASGIEKSSPQALPIKKLADKLQHHLQSPSDNLVISHYFLLEWVKQLGQTAAWIVTILRDRGYIDHTQGIRRDRIQLKGGYTELAQMLGVSERQIESWLPPLDEMVRRKTHPTQETSNQDSAWAKRQNKRALVSYFLDKEGEIDWSGDHQTTYEFKVKLEDPLTPQHQEIYEVLEELLHESLVSGDPTGMASLITGLESALVRESHNLTECWCANDTTSSEPDPRMTQADGDLVRESHTSWCANDTAKAELGARFAHLKALLIKHLYPKALLEIKQLLQQHLEELRASEPVETERDGVGGGHLIWNWEKLLGYGGLSAETRAEILQSPEKQAQFLGQVLYGFENKATEEGKGIKSPFKYAEKHRHEHPLPEYIELASLPPSELTAVLEDWRRNGLAYSISDSAFRVARALRENEFLRIIEDAAHVTTVGRGP